jgi:NTE family protein
VRRYLRAARLHRFGDIRSGAHLRIVAARLDTGEAHIWGDGADDSIFDALMTSTAFPPFHPPWRCNGTAYVDGAFAANLPIDVAVERGAQEIFALYVTREAESPLSVHGAADITFHACQAFLTQQLESQMQLVTKSLRVTLHYVPLTAFANLPVWDFSHTTELIRNGRAVMEMYLDGLPHPKISMERTWLDNVRVQGDRVRQALDRRGRFLPGTEYKIVSERG